ncbi:hypothetical protein [Nitrosococcus oceani]|uniref:hypothetical protein n=1 Tax=Nitrosococcus oceani TaxID=1229 RepID=UPI0004E9031C|nr:hypothetical protein [Nitrosococcus oceani]KFI22593.1 hypothetical protein HW44_08530 [Nitrosococcus oceani]
MLNSLPSDILFYVLIVFVLGTVIGIFSGRFLWSFVIPPLIAAFLFGLEAGSLVAFAYALFMIMTPPIVIASGVGALLGVTLFKKFRRQQGSKDDL